MFTIVSHGFSHEKKTGFPVKIPLNRPSETRSGCQDASQGVLPLEDRSSRVGTARALDAKRDGGAEGRDLKTGGAWRAAEAMKNGDLMEVKGLFPARNGDNIMLSWDLIVI